MERIYTHRPGLQSQIPHVKVPLPLQSPAICRKLVDEDMGGGVWFRMLPSEVPSTQAMTVVGGSGLLVQTQGIRQPQ